MTIMADLKNFTLAHKIYVIDKDEIKTITQASIKNMPEVICELANQYKPTKVTLAGNKKYSADLKDKIQHTFTAKFACECPFEIEQ